MPVHMEWSNQGAAKAGYDNLECRCGRPFTFNIYVAERNFLMELYHGARHVSGTPVSIYLKNDDVNLAGVYAYELIDKGLKFMVERGFGSGCINTMRETKRILGKLKDE